MRRLAPGVSPSPAVVTALRQAMDAFNVVIVDWCRCSVIDASSVADYLAPLRLCLSTGIDLGLPWRGRQPAVEAGAWNRSCP